MQTKPLVWVLAFSTLFFGILMPPEAFPASRMAVILAATFIFLISILEKRIPLSYLAAGAVIFGFLLAHSLVVSVDMYRSLDMLTVFWAYYCLAGFFIYSPPIAVELFAGAVVVLSVIVSAYGLYQYFWGFERIYDYIFYSTSQQMLKAPALQIISTGRVYSTLTLPGTLWGFLAVALPIHGILWKRSRLLNAALIASATLLLAAGFLTRSFGFVAGLLALTVAALWIRHRKLLWNRLTPLVIAFAIVAALFYLYRRNAIHQANPVTLRFANFISAWNIFSAHPWGTGLNTFGVMYFEYILPDANDTQFVHDTPLQLLSELGYPLLFAVALIAIIAAGSRRPRSFTEDPARFYLVLALVVWIVHNLIDIDVYFPSVGVFGTILLALLLRRDATNSRPIPRVWIGATAAAATAVIVFAASVMVATELQFRAQEEYEFQKRSQAAATLEEAKRVCPINSSLYFDSGEILLDIYQRTKDRKYLDHAAASYKRAILLSPHKSGPHIGLALCLSSGHDVPAALKEMHVAAALHPGSPYVLSISKLMEQQVQ